MNFPKNVYEDYKDLYLDKYFKISEDRFKGKKDYELIDLSLKGFNEHKAFRENFPKYLKITRRGLSFLRKKNEKEINLHILRKGLPKFFELNLKDLREKEEFVYFSFEKEKLDINFYEEKIDLFITNKLNGLNIQLSYDNFLEKFIIGSKNVTVTANFFKEIKKEDFFDKVHILNICKIILKKLNLLNSEKKIN